MWFSPRASSKPQILLGKPSQTDWKSSELGQTGLARVEVQITPSINWSIACAENTRFGQCMEPTNSSHRDWKSSELDKPASIWNGTTDEASGRDWEPP